MISYLIEKALYPTTTCPPYRAYPQARHFPSVALKSALPNWTNSTYHQCTSTQTLAMSATKRTRSCTCLMARCAASSRCPSWARQSSKWGSAATSDAVQWLSPLWTMKTWTISLISPNRAHPIESPLDRVQFRAAKTRKGFFSSIMFWILRRFFE